jgi:hypothetical protein
MRGGIGTHVGVVESGKVSNFCEPFILADEH